MEAEFAHFMIEIKELAGGKQGKSAVGFNGVLKRT